MVQHTPVQGNYSLSKAWTCHMNNIPFGPCSSLEGLSPDVLQGDRVKERSLNPAAPLVRQVRSDALA